jgi:hypothetical protein
MIEKGDPIENRSSSRSPREAKDASLITGSTQPGHDNTRELSAAFQERMP